MTEHTPEMIALAEEIADRDILPGGIRTTHWFAAKRAALAAIVEVTERAARYVELDDGRNLHRVTARQIRNGDHLK